MIFPLPAWLSRPAGQAHRLRRRVAEVREKYRRLGFEGGSPQLEYACEKAGTGPARSAARARPHGDPAVAMRYWHPFTDEARRRRCAEPAREQFLVVPTYPQYCAATNGSSTAGARAGARGRALGSRPARAAGLAAAAGLRDAARASGRRRPDRLAGCGRRPRPRAPCVYTAHSLPERFSAPGRRLRAADPRHGAGGPRRAARGPGHGDWLDALRTGGRELALAFQSKVGPVKWIGPPTEATCVELARGGVTHLLVVPVSFNCEHIETIDGAGQRAALRRSARRA